MIIQLNNDKFYLISEGGNIEINNIGVIPISRWTANGINSYYYGKFPLGRLVKEKDLILLDSDEWGYEIEHKTFADGLTCCVGVKEIAILKPKLQS